MKFGRRAARGWAGYKPYRLSGCLLDSGFPLLMAGGSDGVDVGDAINYSVRFNSADLPKLNRIPSAYTNNLKYTVFFRVKRAALGTTQTIWGVHNGIGTNAGYLFLKFNTSDQLFLEGWSTNWRISSRVFRDVSKFYNIQLDIDTATGVAAADKIRIYVDGVRMADSEFGTLNNPADNAVLGTDTPASPGMRWGINYIDAQALNGYLCTATFVDGSNPASSTFVRTSTDTGAVVPKTPAGITWGTSGALLEFKTGASASDLGTDTSGNGNTFTVTNLSVTAGAGNDWLTDTPTNTYATFNPLGKFASNNAAFSQGALTFTCPGNPSQAALTMPMFSGSYVEVTIESVDSARCYVGLIPQNGEAQGQDTYNIAGCRLLDYGGYDYPAGTPYDTSLGGMTNGTIIGVAYKNGKLFFHRNGTWYNSADPVAGTGQMVSGLDDQPRFLYVGHLTSFSVNAGQRAFAYTPPTGYSSLCTANMPTPANLKGTNGFVAVSDLGSSVEATLATARSGWGGSPYLEIFECRSDAEGNRWRYSDDSSNALDSTNTNGKAAFPALTSGRTYAGYAFRIATAQGMATGTVSHTSGAADTITHNLGNAKGMILVKRTDAAGSWFQYHPSLTAGKLLYFDGSAAETTDSTINTVGANSFVLGSGAATGTYRWFVVAETAGVSAIVGGTGNTSTDGAYYNCNGLPKFALLCGYAAARFPMLYDGVRSPINAMSLHQFFSRSSLAEQTSARDIDFVSSGIKLRTSDGEVNSSAGFALWVMLGSHIKYSNAR